MSHHYDGLELASGRDDPGYRTAWRQRLGASLDAISTHVPPGSRLLDVAAAQGNFSLALANLGYQVTWNDIREDLAGYVRLKDIAGHLEYAPGNVLDLTFERPFDAVLATEVIEHVAHPDAFLARLRQLVRPGGHVVITTPNGAYFRNRLPRFSDCQDPSVFEAQQFKPDSDGHIFLLHPAELRDLATEAGLSVVRLDVFCTFLGAGYLGSGRLLRWLPAALADTLEAAALGPPRGITRRLMVQLRAVLKRDESDGASAGQDQRSGDTVPAPRA